MNDILIPFLTQLAGQSPVLFVYLVGIVLALVFWRRYPRPCAFTVIAMGLLMLTSVGQTFVDLYLVVYRGIGQGWDPERLRWVLTANALAGVFVRALAFGLLLAAVFVDRESRGEAELRAVSSVADGSLQPNPCEGSAGTS